MRIKLTTWNLAGYYPFTPLLSRSPEIGQGSGCVTPAIEARVPGSVYADLHRAGIIEDPYFERNSLLCEWVKDRFWVYGTAVTIKAGMRTLLHLDGIDYHAHIFVGDTKLGEHENMFVPFVADISHLVKGEGEITLPIQVILECAPDEMGQIGYTDRTHTQKARYTYKWDFCTRLVGMGLWREAWIEQIPGARIGATKADWDGEAKQLTYCAQLDRPAHLTLLISDKDGRVIFTDEREMEQAGCYSIQTSIEAPDLWYPNGYGTQPLYTVDLIAKTPGENGLLSDEKRERIGLRTLTYRQCEGARADSLPYIPVINGRPIFIKGVNCVPMDLMTGCESAEKRRHLLSLIRDMGCNLIRVWGGGIIESEDFYELCDEYGLMIWQEMPQSSSGISNQPSHNRHFLALLAQTCKEAAITKRNHASLTFFSGGNELTDEHTVPSTFSDPNLSMVRQVLSAHAPHILILPTSASGPTEYGSEKPEENHDVHGPWKYAGIVGQYAHFNHITHQLHSEFGCDGMTNPERLGEFLLPHNRAHADTVAENLTWRHHGEWWDTFGYREKPLFGDLDGNLDTLILLSQYMQAEGLRYALEANRRRQWQCGGSIIWQFNEPWPGISGTNLVDYKGEPKLAYEFCRDAFSPFHVSLRYDKLVWQEGEAFTATAYLHDDSASVPVSRLSEREGAVFTATLWDERSLPVAEFDGGEISFPLTGLGRSFRLSLKVTDGERTDENTYLFFIRQKEEEKLSVSAVKRYVKWYRKKEASLS